MRSIPLLCSLFSVLPIVLSAQAASLKVPENLEADGLPPIPMSVAAAADRYTEARSASFVDWHPVNQEVLIATRFANTAQLHQVKIPLGTRRQLTFFDEPVNNGVYDPVKGDYIIFARDSGGNEFGQLYRFDLATRNVTLLSDGGRSQNGAIRFTNKGDGLAFTSTRRNGADRDIYFMNPLDPRSSRMLLEVKGGGWGLGDWSPDDQSLIVSQNLSVTRSRLYLLDVRSGALRLLAPADTSREVVYQFGRYSADGRRIWALSDDSSEFRRLGWISPATGAWTPITTGINWDVDGYDASPDGKQVAFVTNEAGTSRLYLYDVATGKSRQLPVPEGIMGTPSWHPKGRYFAFTFSNARSTADVWVWDTATGRLARWTESELGNITPEMLQLPEPIRWKSFDGLEITGFYTRPPAKYAGKRPVIIDIHGGPEGQTRPGYNGRFNYFVNELGIAVIRPNVRGSTGFGKTFVSLDNGPRREDSVKDIGALLDWIAGRPELDASRVMVTGGSYGGYMVLAVATMYPERIAAAVDIVGISNFITFLEKTEAYRRDLRRVEYGDERDPEMRAVFERISPANKVDRIAKPLFVIQGANDPRVPKNESDQMVAKVKEKGTPVWYLIGKNEGHGFQKKENQDFQFYAMVEFADRYLVPPPATP